MSTAATSFDSTAPFSAISYNREDKKIVFTLKLAATATIDPSFKEIAAYVYYKDQAEYYVFTRAVVIKNLQTTGTAVSLEMPFDKTGFVALAELKEYAQLPGESTVKEIALGSKALSCIGRPDAPVLAISAIGSVTKNTDPSKLDLGTSKVKIPLNGNNGGGAFAAYTAYRYIVDSNGVVGAPTVLGSANTSITQSDIDAGYVEIAFAVTAITPKSLLLVRAALDNGCFESRLSEPVSFSISKAPVKPVILKVYSAQQSFTSNKLKTIVEAKLAANDNNELWLYAVVQLSKDSGSTWTNASYLAKADVLSAIASDGFFQITCDGYSSNSDALTTGLLARVVLGQSTAPTAAATVGADETASDNGKWLGNFDKNTLNTLSVTGGTYDSTNNNFSFRATRAGGVTYTSSTVAMCEWIIADKVYKRNASTVASGSNAPTAYTLTVPSGDLPVGAKVFARFTQYSPLLPTQIDRHVYPAPTVDPTTGQTILVHALVNSTSYSMPSKTVPLAKALSVSEYTSSSNKSLIVSFLEDQAPADHKFLRSEVQVATDSSFSAANLLNLATGTSGSSTGVTTLQTNASNSGDLAETILVPSYVYSNPSWSQNSFGSNAQLYVRIRLVMAWANSSTSADEIVGDWVEQQYLTKPAQQPAAPTNAALAKYSQGPGLEFSFSKVAASSTYAGFVDPAVNALNYIVTFFDVQGVKADEQTIPYGTDATIKVLSNLLPGQTYTAKVVAIYADKNGNKIASDQSALASYTYVKAPSIKSVVITQTATSYKIDAVVDQYNALSVTVKAVLPYLSSSNAPALIADLNAVAGSTSGTTATYSNTVTINPDNKLNPALPQPQALVIALSSGGHDSKQWPSF